MPQQVNIYAQVNSKSIRREKFEGREHVVIPSYTLKANSIMNGGLYKAEEIDAHYKNLEGTLAPLGHPTIDGKFVSAFQAPAINKNHIGAWNRNVKKVGDRIYSEKWVDVNKAKESEQGRRLMDRIEAMEKGESTDPIHTSIAVFLEREPATNSDGKYSWVAKFHQIDHDAILLDEVGANTPEDGVGLMVNSADAVSLAPNEGALLGESYRNMEQRLQDAARERFVTDAEKEYVWIADFTDEQAIVVRNGGEAEVYGYKTEGGRVVFEESGSPVQRRESWVSKIPVVNRAVEALSKLLSPNSQARLDITEKEGDMPLTAEEKAELLKGVGDIVGNQLKPLADEIGTLKSGLTALQANQDELSKTLTANQRAEEEDMRKAVAAKHGEVVANALSGDALAAMYKSVKPAPGINPAGDHQAPTAMKAPDVNQHFGDVKA